MAADKFPSTKTLKLAGVWRRRPRRRFPVSAFHFPAFRFPLLLYGGSAWPASVQVGTASTLLMK
jgi:hypothetical protein